jgi:hypothetical protein
MLAVINLTFNPNNFNKERLKQRMIKEGLRGSQNPDLDQVRYLIIVNEIIREENKQ